MRSPRGTARYSGQDPNSPTLQRRVHDLLESVPEHGEDQHDNRNEEPMGIKVPPTTRDQSEVNVRLINENSPALDDVRSRCTEAEEGEERFREDGIRNGQNGLRPNERHHVWKDVLPNNETGPGSDCAGPFNELTFLDGQNLGPDDPRGARPAHDGNCQDDRAEAGREDQYEDEHEWKPRYHQEEIRHPREEQVCDAAIESTNDPYRGPNDHRDDRRTKPDDE